MGSSRRESRHEQITRWAPLARRIRVRAPEEQVHLVFDSESQRVRALTVVRHSAISVWCRRSETKMRMMPWNDLCFAAIFYFFTPVSTWIFCFKRLITLSTEFTELPRSFAISSLE